MSAATHAPLALHDEQTDEATPVDREEQWPSTGWAAAKHFVAGDGTRAGYLKLAQRYAFVLFFVASMSVCIVQYHDNGTAFLMMLFQTCCVAFYFVSGIYYTGTESKLSDPVALLITLAVSQLVILIVLIPSNLLSGSIHTAGGTMCLFSNGGGFVYVLVTFPRAMMIQWKVQRDRAARELLVTGDASQHQQQQQDQPPIVVTQTEELEHL